MLCSRELLGVGARASQCTGAGVRTGVAVLLKRACTAGGVSYLERETGARARGRARGGEGRLRKLEATANFFAGCHRLSLGSLAFVRLVAQLLLDLADVGG